MASLQIPLGIYSLEIIAQSVDEQGNIAIDVQSTKMEIPCRKCGKLIHKQYGLDECLTIRHLPILDQPVYLRIKVVRYQCMDCDSILPHRKATTGLRESPRQPKLLIVI